MKTLTALAALVVFALIATACGGGSDSADNADAELIAAIEADLGTEPPPDGLDADIGCMARGMVSALGGADEIESKYGITADGVKAGESVGDLELDQPTAETMTNNLWECGDFSGLILSGFAGEGMTDEQAACVAGLIDESLLKKVFTAQFMGTAGAALGEEAQTELITVGFDAVGQCGLGA